MTGQLTVRVRIMHLPDCPLLERLRANLRQALTASGVSVEVEEREGAYPSPTMLVNGHDVLTGQPLAPGACCRLELPTAAQIADALGQGGSS